jgi:hypothetical protein
MGASLFGMMGRGPVWGGALMLLAEVVALM